MSQWVMSQVMSHVKKALKKWLGLSTDISDEGWSSFYIKSFYDDIQNLLFYQDKNKYSDLTWEWILAATYIHHT